MGFLKYLSCGFFLILVGCSLFGRRTEETPKYEVVLKNKNMEIRHYSPYLVAETRVQGDFKEAQTQAFRILAGYIFGSNEKQSKISMTAPVVMNPQSVESEKISMTAPVIQSPSGDGWQMSFSMPSKYKSLEELPRPKDSRINLRLMPAQYIGAIGYSGFWTEENNQQMAEQLKTWIHSLSEYEVISEPRFAGYDPPWTLPFLRRNEMLLEIKKK